MFSNTQRIAGVEREKKPETKPTQSENHRNRKANIVEPTDPWKMELKWIEMQAIQLLFTVFISSPLVSFISLLILLTHSKSTHCTYNE